MAGVPLFVSADDKTNLAADLVCHPVDLDVRARARRALHALERVIG